jgi:hypothetical protein
MAWAANHSLFRLLCSIGAVRRSRATRKLRDLHKQMLILIDLDQCIFFRFDPTSNGCGKLPQGA